MNLAGYAAGLRNPVHSIEGRLNFPFGQGFYSIANTVAIINLIIIGKWFNGIADWRMKMFTIFHFLLNMFIMMGVNSRLSILIFALIAVLWLLRILYQYYLMYTVSLFTLPLLLGFSEWIYQILSLPLFSILLKRVSYRDVTGFNGRRDLWERGLEWFRTMGDGFFWGNGYHGYYYIGLVDDLEQFWSKSAINLHMHSSALEFVLSIGAVGLLPLMILFFLAVAYIRKKALARHDDGILLGVIFYLVFVFQIDNFVYITNYGAFIFFVIVSAALVRKPTPSNQSLDHAKV
jgi:O-antigen ligase